MKYISRTQTYSVIPNTVFGIRTGRGDDIHGALSFSSILSETFACNGGGGCKAAEYVKGFKV